MATILPLSVRIREQARATRAPFERLPLRASYRAAAAVAVIAVVTTAAAVVAAAVPPAVLSQTSILGRSMAMGKVH